jgi:RNA polymerase sigma factor (sigma-70 family)
MLTAYTNFCLTRASDAASPPGYNPFSDEKIAMHEINLTQEAAAGDRLALQRLLLANYDTLTAHIAPRIPPRLRRAIDAEDVVQEASRCIHRDIARQFEPRGEGSFLAWAKSIAEKRLFDRISAESCQKRGGDLRRLSAEFLSGSVADFLGLQPADVLTPSRNVACREAIEALLESIERLPREQREAIQLSLAGKELDEIAEALGRTRGAVRGLIHRARVRLRDELGSPGAWFSRGDVE